MAKPGHHHRRRGFAGCAAAKALKAPADDDDVSGLPSFPQAAFQQKRFGDCFSFVGLSMNFLLFLLPCVLSIPPRLKNNS